MLLVELHLLPPIPTFIQAIKKGGLILESYETYQKRSFRNKFDIIDAQGLHTISIPLKKGKNEKMPIREVEIAYDEAWENKLVKKISTAYGKAAYFPDYSDSLFELINSGESRLYDFSKGLLLWVIEVLEISVNITETSEYKIHYEAGITDWRNKKLSFYRNHSSKEYMSYAQVFEYNHGFIPNLSIIDMIFNCGPETEIMLNEAASE